LSISFVCFVYKYNEERKMLKAYAVALVLSTTAPVAADKQEGAQKAPVQKKEVATETQSYRPKTGAIRV
jgi:hypothetical protein